MDLHPDFRDLLAEFVRYEVSFAVLGGYAERVLSLDDLIANKRAAARAQDLADVALLERVRARQQP